jgi:hypothetical protein
MVTIFASSGGDGDTLNDIMQTLATPERAVSPTRFHNSVHNAASGYWALATGSQQASTSLGAYDASFAAGLLEAATQAQVEQRMVTLIAYDHPFPEPLHGARPIAAPFGVALVLTPVRSQLSIAAVHLTLAEAGTANTMADPAFEALRLGNPAARALPLLVALARGEGDVRLATTGRVTLDLRVSLAC